MKKLTILLLTIIILSGFAAKTSYAKVWTKDLVDKVTLNSGYKFSICTIDLAYDRSNNPSDTIFDAKEKEFEANPDAFPCNKQSQEDILFADITLYFNKAKWNGISAPEKLIEFQNNLYSVNQFSTVLTDPNGKTDITDISPYDWFSDIPTIYGIRGATLINTNPNAAANQQNLSNSSFIIMHDSSGKFTTALFIFNNKVYKFSALISKITTPTTLVDYTQPAIENLTPTITNSDSIGANWNLHKNVDYPFQIKYPKDWTLRTTYGNSVKNTGNNRIAGIDINTGTPGYGSVLVVNIINPQGKSLEDWLRQNMSNSYVPTKTSFQGFSAYQYSYSTQPNRLDTVEIYFQYKDKIIFLAWNLISGVDQPNADQIMSTLKFTQ